ncbi:MAG TPA: diguanylate cyclase, partial [candidate division Zixibacteria bacterium]|nr:diguanylate cyclase [candidate division Zixibacteria bacterium]
MFHCALRQERVDLVSHLERIFPAEEISFHYFRTFEDLLRISQRFVIDLALIGGASEFGAEIELTRRIKQNVFTSIIPTALYHPEPDNATLVAAYECGCDDFLAGRWEERLFEVRLKMLARRSQRDISVNPSSMLPGPSLIEREIERQIALGQEFAVCYTDLDNFKAYNDAYGYYYGDKIIRLTARIIRDTVFDLCPEGFVGHIGGDDFIYIIPSDQVQP